MGFPGRFFGLPIETSLKVKFPDIKTVIVKESLDQNWKGK